MSRADDERRRLLAYRLGAADRLRMYTKSAVDAYEREIAAIEQEERRLAALEGQVEVFVRRPGGPRVETYHLETCGKLPTYNKRLYLGEALERGLRPCWFCMPPNEVPKPSEEAATA
jgi:hypothetical protein